MSTDAPTSTDAPSGEADAEEAPPRDDAREALVGRLGEMLGDALVETHIRPGDDLWIRVDRNAWGETGRIARDRLGCRYFSFLSGLDWLPSPFGRSLDAEVDKALQADEPTETEDAADTADDAAPGIVTGYAGGDTRFQVFARVENLKEGWGLTIKADLPDDDLRVESWIPNYAGANWHERECHEMFGFTFDGHPYLRNLYLPGAFEGYPLRKDFPLVARLVKAWPGIVDVEDMPEVPPDETGEGAETGQDGEGDDAGGAE